ncbi:hypothetical protein HJFPF1_05077 [Paramyrothecium foliicola]|nr:hypothetical protein HJFPF1_05077 [Paramyrothecium foliicola]
MRCFHHGAHVVSSLDGADEYSRRVSEDRLSQGSKVLIPELILIPPIPSEPAFRLGGNAGRVTLPSMNTSQRGDNNTFRVDQGKYVKS